MCCCFRVVDGYESVSDKEDLDENFCAYYDEDDCRFAYVYSYDEKGKIVIKAQKDRECPPHVYILGKQAI